jgi:hypothetical protein
MKVAHVRVRKAGYQFYYQFYCQRVHEKNEHRGHFVGMEGELEKTTAVSNGVVLCCVVLYCIVLYYMLQ